LAQVEAVRRGKTPSVASLAEYKEARAALPQDANLMVFASPSAFVELAKSMGAPNADQISSTFKEMRWLGMSLTLRDDGIEIKAQAPQSSSTPASVAQIPALKDGDLFKRLPGGAFGLWAASQPAKYYEMFQANMKD